VLGPLQTYGWKKSNSERALTLRSAWGRKNNDPLFVAADMNNRKVMWLAQGYTCNLWQSWDSHFHLASQCLNQQTFIPLTAWKWPSFAAKYFWFWGNYIVEPFWALVFLAICMSSQSQNVLRWNGQNLNLRVGLQDSQYTLLETEGL